MSKLFLAALISLLCLTSCTARTPEATPEPLPTLPEETVIPEPAPTPEPWSEEEVTVLAKMVWGRGPGCPLRYRESGLCLVRSQPCRSWLWVAGDRCNRSISICRV